MKKLLSCILLFSLLNIVGYAMDYITVYPLKSDEIIKNPFRGFQTTVDIYATLDDNYFTRSNTTTMQQYLLQNPNLNKDIWNRLSVIYTRPSWVDLQPENLQSQTVKFAWYYFDRKLSFARSKNMQMGLGFMGANVNANSNDSKTTPDWVFNSGAQYKTYTPTGTTKVIKIPVWDDPIYMQKYSEAIQGLKQKYDGNPDISYFDMRNFGNWGEWHLYVIPKSVGSSDISTEKKIEHVDMWSGFKSQLFMLSNSNASILAANNGNLEPEVMHAITALKAGVRRDGCTTLYKPTEHIALTPAYNYSVPANAEWWSGYSSLKSNGYWSPTMFERVIKEGKPTYFSFSMYDEATFYMEQKDLIDRWVNRLGYWFKLSEVSFSSDFATSGSGILSAIIKNDGVAPIYPNKENQAYVKLALLDNSNNVISTTILDGINPHDWEPGTYSNISVPFSFNQTVPNGKLAIGIFTDINMSNPNVRFCNIGTEINKWYILSDSPRYESKNFAYNKIYSSSSEYQDDLWGYRSANYAFDDDTNTYWSPSANNNSSWIEVDFGTDKTFNNCFIKKDSALTSYTVQYYDNGWKDAYVSSAIWDEKKLLQFNAVTSSKARLLINTSTTLAKVYELQFSNNLDNISVNSTTDSFEFAPQSNIFISPISYQSLESSITSLKDKTDIVTSFKAKSPNKLPISFFTALYDNENLIDIKIDKANLTSTEQVFTHYLHAKAPLTNQAVLKTFMWGNASEIQPLANPITFGDTQNNSNWKFGETWKTIGDNSLTGYYSLSTSGDAVSSSITNKEISLLPFTTYDLTFYAKGNKQFAYKIVDETGAEVLTEKQFIFSDDWQKCSNLFATGAHSEFKIVFSDIQGSGTSYIDDVTITNNEILASNLIKNFSFNIDLTSWDKYSGSNINLVTGYDGNCAQVYNRTSDYYGLRQYITGNLQNSGTGTYTLRFHMKTSASSTINNSISVTVRVNGVSSTQYATVGSEWTLIEKTFNLNWTGSLTSADIILQTDKNDTRDLYFDNFSLIKK